MARLDVRRPFFWIAVGGTAILANFFVEVAAQKLPSGGFQKFVAFLHKGPGGSQA